MFGALSENPKKVIDYVDDLREKLLSVHETVRHKIRVASDRMKTRYDLKGNSVGFQAGDLVWLYNPRRRKGRCPKLSPDREGPSTVVARINDVVYRIRRGPKTKMKIVHLDRPMKYNSDTVGVSDRDAPVWVLVCDDVIVCDGGRALKKSLEAEVAMGIPERPRLWNF